MSTTVPVNDRPDSLNRLDRFVQIDLARNWGDDWIPHPECEASDLTVQSVGEGIERFSFTRRYGLLRFPHESADVGPHVVPPWTDSDIEGAWVRVSWIEIADWVTELDGITQSIDVGDGFVRYIAFIGQVQTPQDNLSGGGMIFSGSAVLTGVQSFTAYGPADYLRRIPMNTSLVEPLKPEEPPDPEDPTEPEKPQAINWIMSPNYDLDGDMVKNRSKEIFPITNGDDKEEEDDGGDEEEENEDEEEEGTYIFGPGEYWTSSDYALYLGRLINKPDKPQFRFEIESDLKSYLEKDIVKISLGTAENILDVLKKVFNPGLGMDFFVRPFNGELNGGEFEGFAIRVFSLAEADGTFDGIKFPKSQTGLAFNISGTHSLGGTVSLSRNQEQRYRHFRVIGNRVKIACTFSLGDHGDGFPKLVKGWSDELEEEYKKALWPNAEGEMPEKKNDGSDFVGTGEEIEDQKKKVAAEANDSYRTQEKFRDVYSLFVLPESFRPKAYFANPEFDANGNFVRADSDIFQTIETAILDELPKWEVDKDEKNTNQLKIMGWTFRIYPPLEDEEFDVYVRAMEKGGSLLEAIPKKFAIRLRNDFKTYLADDWDYDKYYTCHVPFAVTSYKNLIVTICWESDFRIALAYEDTGANEDLGTMSVENKDAELWYYAPCTFFGELDAKGFPVFCSDPEYVDGKITFPNAKTFDEKKQIGRNDIKEIKSQMAALVARHGRRPRAVVPLAGEWPIAHFIGMGIDTYQDGEFTHRPNSVVTRIEMFFGAERRTTVYGGGS